MKSHLSPEQFSRHVLGDCTPDELKHGRECPQCRAELSRFKETLAVFRDSVHNWADRQISPAPAVGGLRRRHGGIRPILFRWAIVSVALAIAVLLPIYKYNGDREQALRAAADALLLQQVNMHLSRTAPVAMEPFFEMLAEEPASDKTINGEPR